MKNRESKLKQAIDISNSVRKIQYYKEPLSVIKGDKKKLLSGSFEIRISGIKGSVYGEFSYDDVVQFLNYKVKQENANLNMLLK